MDYVSFSKSLEDYANNIKKAQEAIVNAANFLNFSLETMQQSLPSINLPTLPKINIPTIPKIVIPTFPKIEIPSIDLSSIIKK